MHSQTASDVCSAAMCPAGCTPTQPPFTTVKCCVQSVLLHLQHQGRTQGGIPAAITQLAAPWQQQQLSASTARGWHVWPLSCVSPAIPVEGCCCTGSTDAAGGNARASSSGKTPAAAAAAAASLIGLRPSQVVTQFWQQHVRVALLAPCAGACAV